MSTITKCSGCGATFQSEHKDQVGYVKSPILPYCESCYKLLHYGESEFHFHPKDLPNLPENSLLIMVSSVLHLDLIFSYPVYRYQPNATFIYIINQMDLLPESTNTDELLKHITDKANQQKIPFKDIIMMSAKNPFDIAHLSTYIKSLPHKNIYLLGVQNSGKTTLFKALTNDENALAMKKAGLTQDALVKPFYNQFIYDMPGLYQKGYLHQLFSYQTYKKLIPDQTIKPRIYQLKTSQSLLIEGIISLTLKSKDITCVLYLENQVKIHKTNENKVDELIANRKVKSQVYAKKYEDKTFRIPNDKAQITFADMGFLHIDGPGLIKIKYPKDMHISITEALFK
jgi:ribosome biogenesis GTPase A